MERVLYKALALTAPFLLVLLWRYVSKATTHPRNLPCPPGPKPLPIIGNIYDVPTGAQWLGFADLSRRYGDLLFLRVLGQPILVLNSMESALDLLERRSSIYSDRFQSTMASLSGWDWNLSLMPYGDRWRAHRRGFNQHFNQKASKRYAPIQEEKLLKFLRALLVQPEEFLSLTRFSFAASIFKVIYGIEIKDSSDKYLQAAEESLKSLVEIVVPGSFWVDFLPLLKYVPVWMPGARFRRKAAEWTVPVTATNEAPFEAARSSRMELNSFESVVHRMMESAPYNPHTKIEEEVMKNVCGIGFAGGADTSMSTSQSFFFAMAAHPEVQKQAQQELDEVVGDNRLPVSADCASLPYIDAIVKECLRWQPVLPLGVAHRSNADDEYRGYYISKGTIVVVNQWGLLHDPQVYPNPEKFDPDRFIKDGQLDPLITDPKNVAFGFGRRICPGRYFAESSLFLTIASVLHVFNISPSLNEYGKPIQPEIKMTTGGLSYPEPFNCIIKPRSMTRAALVDKRTA